MKKAALIVLAILMMTVVAVSVTGCGGDSSSSDEKTTTTIPKATNATTMPDQTQSYTKYSGTGNGMGIATTGASTGTGTQSTTVATAPTRSESAGEQVDDPAAAKAKAMSYYNTSESAGATVDFLGMQEAPDGTWYYLAYVNMPDGKSLPVYVTIDGTVAYEPEAYYSAYGITPDVELDSDSGSSESAADAEAAAADY